MKRQAISAQVHRFRDYVAIWLGSGETVYLTPKEARQLTRAINRAARSCELEPFETSTAGTKAFRFGGAE